ncbi:MAG: diaminopimelate epimerase [Deltaproteobacteria bacterium ADurb.Bin510]|nr:MAG: diaminopimelate epimerase [Deltaproteobacteria bacterium ADurb.Bin510]
MASALLAHATGRVKTQPVKVTMPGGQLKIDFKKDGDAYTEAWLIGKVDTVYTAKLI